MEIEKRWKKSGQPKSAKSPPGPHASGLGLDRCQVLQRLGNKKTNRTRASNSCWWYFCSLGYIWFENFNVFVMILSSSTWWFQPTRQIGSFPPTVASILHDHHLIHCCIVVGDKSFVWFMRCHVWLWIYICTWMHAGLQNRMSVWAHILHLPLCGLGFRSRIYMWNHQTQHILTPTCVCIPATYKHGCMSAYDSHMQFRSDWSLYRNPSLKISCFVKCAKTPSPCTQQLLTTHLSIHLSNNAECLWSAQSSTNAWPVVTWPQKKGADFWGDWNPEK